MTFAFNSHIALLRKINVKKTVVYIHLNGDMQ